MDSVEYWLGKFLKLKDGEIGFLFSTYFILKIVGSTKIMYEYPELGTPSGIEKREWSDESWEN